jgi:hypothetical protein
MAIDKELAVIDRRDRMLLQSNKATMAIMDYNNTQHNVFILMIEAIQKYMTNSEPVQVDLFKNPIIRIDASKISDKCNKPQVLSEVVKMGKQEFYDKSKYKDVYFL